MLIQNINNAELTCEGCSQEYLGVAAKRAEGFEFSVVLSDVGSRLGVTHNHSSLKIFKPYD